MQNNDNKIEKASEGRAPKKLNCAITLHEQLWQITDAAVGHDKHTAQSIDSTLVVTLSLTASAMSRERKLLCRSYLQHNQWASSTTRETKSNSQTSLDLLVVMLGLGGQILKSPFRWFDFLLVVAIRSNNSCRSASSALSLFLLEDEIPSALNSFRAL